MRLKTSLDGGLFGFDHCVRAPCLGISIIIVSRFIVPHIFFHSGNNKPLNRYNNNKLQLYVAMKHKLGSLTLNAIDYAS